MLTLAEKLSLESSLTDSLKKLNEASGKKIRRLTEKCSGGDFSCLKNQSDLMRLAVILCCAVKVHERYEKEGISDEIYYHTMSDIKIWCENNGNKGLKNYGWLKNHVSFELFRLGRLQFQLYECKNKTLLYHKLPFSYGDRLIYIHIPQGEKLEKERCLESISMATEFFKKHFPDFKYKHFFTESWLLYEGNRDFMHKDSNIVSFMSLFDIHYSVKYPEQAIERIFGKRQLFKRNYPESTDLQRRAKKYLLGGGRLGIGVGTIRIRNSEWRGKSAVTI